MALSENIHVSVLRDEVLDAFGTVQPGVVLDGTLGGGGHTLALLKRYPQIKVLGCDLDQQAISLVQNLGKEFVEAGRLSFLRGNFSEIGHAIAPPEEFNPPWAGALLDLGYSSNQLENPDFGLSFQTDGKLSMSLRGRDSKHPDAWHILAQSTETELGDIFEAYGEIPGAHKLAAQIKRALGEAKIQNSTLSLAHTVERLRPRKKKGDIHPATLVFQALRIAVNDELRQLDHFLENVTIHTMKGAILAVITFHSLEDRIVKLWGKSHEKQWTPLTKKPIAPSASEIKINPRARSAKLRAYQKC